MQIRHDGFVFTGITSPVIFYLSLLPFPSVTTGAGRGYLPRMTSATLPHSTQPTTSRRMVVERAEAFLNARIGESVSIAELCEAAGVSERSLRNAFYDVRCMSPKRCAVRARL